MKTKIIIEIETKDMKEVKENEDFTGKIITDEIEKSLHNSIKEYFKEFETKEGFGYESFEETILCEYENVFVENFDQLTDYGDIELNVKTV